LIGLAVTVAMLLGVQDVALGRKVRIYQTEVTSFVDADGTLVVLVHSKRRICQWRREVIVTHIDGETGEQTRGKGRSTKTGGVIWTRPPPDFTEGDAYRGKVKKKVKKRNKTIIFKCSEARMPYEVYGY
jgi:hypothetical protein